MRISKQKIQAKMARLHRQGMCLAKGARYRVVVEVRVETNHYSRKVLQVKSSTLGSTSLFKNARIYANKAYNKLLQEHK